MVLNKRLDYGSSGHLVPPMPRVPRSARGKRSARKRMVIEDKQISAFDLLATVAGELLSEKVNCASPCRTSQEPKNSIAVKGDIKQEQHEVVMPIKTEAFDQGSCNESTLGSESVVFKKQIGCTLKEKDVTMPKSEVGIKTPLQPERRANVIKRGENVPGKMEDYMDLDVKPPAFLSSDSSVELPMRRNGSFSQYRDGMELPVQRDDDDNSSGCTHPSTNNANPFRAQHIGDRRIRKLLASKFWKVPQTALKDGELLHADEEMRPVFRSKKMCYTRQRTQRSSFKRRKLFERRSVSASAGLFCGESTPNSPKFNGIKTETREAHAGVKGVIGASSSTSGQKSSFERGDCHVKFSIKSFKVPELYIEIPENATVGSLKRTVMEAVTAILTGGMRVGVLLQGKKVRDDKLTLMQAGISRNDKMENLGFTLEPNPTQAPALAYPDPVPNSLLPCAPTESIPRTPVVVPAVEQQVPPEAALELPQTSTLNSPESDHDSVHSHTDAASSVKTADSKALVPVPDMSADPLTVLPPRKPRRSELVQRRIRRPFSVAEVEALVQAVEKLGTGRWRDVKIRAFDNAKHRTYVDLKDKWKTLVHTARISPQQRRGEPVPQELLDRVLSAHALWSEKQAKPPAAEACLLI